MISSTFMEGPTQKTIETKLVITFKWLQGDSNQ